MANFSAFYPPGRGGTATNPSIGLNGAPIPIDSTLVGAEDPSGNLQPLQVSAAGDLLVEINNQTSGLATAANQTSQITLETATANNTGNTATSTAQIADATKQIGSGGQPGRSVLVSGTDGVDTLPLSMDGSGNLKVSVQDSSLPTGAATEATLSAFSNKSASSDVSEDYDYRAFTYIGSTQKIDTITYKSGGSGGTTVATQTFGYDGSDRLTSITKT